VQTVQQSGSPTQTWVDWSPNSDTTGNCQTGNITLSVSYIVGISYSNTECEHWDIAKGVPGGSFETIWYKDFLNYVKGNRNVGLLISIKVPQAKLPVWTLTYYVSQ
jgi:hypothetical protein